MNDLVSQPKLSRLDRSHLPAVGSWWYVTPHGVKKNSKYYWRCLMCVENIGSNHVAFSRPKVQA